MAIEQDRRISEVMEREGSRLARERLRERMRSAEGA